jgi:hypothetical protein
MFWCIKNVSIAWQTIGMYATFDWWYESLNGRLQKSDRGTLLISQVQENENGYAMCYHLFW